MSDVIVEPSRETEVVESTDVVVLGGGPAGVAAAIALEDGRPPREISVEKLQEALRAQGVKL